MYIIFLDLDGTLLDHNSYSFEDAKEGLNILKKKGIPLVLCSSKTRTEMEDIRIQIDNNDPFIVENGGAVFMPKGDFDEYLCDFKVIDDYFVIEIGLNYSVIREKFNELKNIVLCSMRGFGDMTVEEISNLTNLSLAKAEKASKREYSEPFVLEDKTQKSKIIKELKGTQFSITKGGRFFHLIGPNNKGLAVKILTDIYRKCYVNESLITVGIGDSKNDIPMLKNVSRPFAVKKFNGEFDKDIVELNVKLVDSIGPVGWNKVIISLFG
jgi:mannosyl-3-phosphoglycerate phosphatase